VSRNMNDEAMWRHDVLVGDLHWIHGAPAASDQLTVRLRHRGQLRPCTLQYDPAQAQATLHLSDPERAVAAGPSAVIYRGTECLGGGIVVDSVAL